MSITAVPLTDDGLPVPALNEPGPAVDVIAVPTSGYEIVGTVTGRMPFTAIPRAPEEWSQSGFTRRMPFSPTLGVQWRLTVPPGSDPEGVFALTGRRPAFPLVVYTLRQADDDLSAIPANGSFVVALSYVPVVGDGLADFGATAGGIGTKVVRADFSDVVVFRLPADNEVVRLVNLTGVGAARDGGYYRWTKGVWKSYSTMPQRAMNGMNAFAALDPDRVYDYWGSLIGGLQCSSTSDAVSLTGFFDVDTVPDAYLGLLGSMLGVTVPQDDPPAIRRHRVRTAVPRNRLRGLAQGVALRLFLMGYVGTAKEIWVKPTAPANWTDVTDAPPGVQAEVLAKGLVIDPASGVKGQDWIEVTHGSQEAYDALAAGYVPSSRITAYVNNRDGSPVSGSLSTNAAESLKQSVASALSEDVLPAQTSVRFFATIEMDASVRYL